jgi:hypothetical protein
MGSKRCFTGVAWSRVKCDKVLRIEGARIWRTREVLGSMGIVEKISSSCWVGEMNSRREERISR